MIDVKTIADPSDKPTHYEQAAQGIIPLKFDVKLYGNLEKYDDSKSKCRVRIFYKGLNRNRTYISEDFANQLIASLPYAPVKGIFNQEDVDFEDHGDKNTDGKIYGVVMADPEFAWEDHMDADGVTRTYACASVLLYTGLYNEAKIIPDSSQSMEINPYTFTGEWRIWEDDGQPYYHFKTGSLFGLQVLGNLTEPCFEGAAFYNLIFAKLQKDYEPLIEHIKQYSKQGENKEMDKLLFRLSDNEKADKIWSLMNPNFNAENGWKIDCCVLDVYDDYAITVSNEGYKRAYYTKNEDDTVTIDKTEVCFMMDVTETEKNALNAMKAAAGSYEAYQNASVENSEKVENLEKEVETLNNSLTEANEKIANAETELNEKVAAYEATISEKETAITDANTKFEALEAEKVELEKVNADLTSEKEELASFKSQIETQKKEDFLLSFAEHLTDAEIEGLKSKMNDYSVEDFEKEVSYVAVKNNPTAFSKSEEPDRYYKGGNSYDEKGLQGWERIMNKYKNGGNK